MTPIRTLLVCGGPIHDWRAVGDVMDATLRSSSEFDVTRIDDDLTVFADPNLEAYDVIVFYWTRGEITDEQMNGLSRFVKSGKGFVGVHGATASFRESPEFHEFLGGLFIKHPEPRHYSVSIRDTEHPITAGLDSEFTIFDEQYTFDYDPRVNVLATALWQGHAHPVIWTKPWGSGRVTYFSLGHDGEIAKQPQFADLLVRCTRWAGCPE
jgi:type 1 glutamine amidotransferase